MTDYENVPTVTIKLGGKLRRMALTFSAQKRFATAAGTPIEVLLSPTVDEQKRLNDQERNQAIMLRLLQHLDELIWAVLVKEDRADFATAEDVGDVLHVGNIEAAAEAVGNLLLALFPKGAEGKAVAAPVSKRPRPSTSTRSGRSASTTSGSPTPSSGA